MGIRFVPQYPNNVAPTRNGTNGSYGAASVYDFENPEKWVTVPDVKVLDEHELDGDNGKPAAYVDRSVLEEIARNNNNRVLTTGDPAPLIVGHTSDDPLAPERPVVGYAVNYRVKESRDSTTGRVSYAIHTDYKVRKDREHVIEDFPRRSVELWLGRKELDPIALLGGTTPERDLGVIIRKARMQFTFGKVPSKNGVRSLQSDSNSPVLHYSKRTGAVIRYSLKSFAGGAVGGIAGGTIGTAVGGPVGGMIGSALGHAAGSSLADLADSEDYQRDDKDDQSTNYSHEGDCMKTMKGKSVKAPGGPVNTKHSYEADPDNEMATDDLPPDMEGGADDTALDDEGFDGDPGADPASEDPRIAGIFQSKAFQKMLADAVKTAIEGLLAAEEGGGAGAGPGAGPSPVPPPGGAAPMGDPGMGGDEPPMDGTDGLAPQPDEEARIDHEGPPVRFEAGPTGYAGPNSSMIPSTQGDRRQPYNRSTTNGSPAMTRTQQRPAARQNPEVVRLSRQLAQQNKVIQDLLVRNARAEAEKTISDFENNAEGHEEGPVIFGDREQEIQVLTAMDPKSREYHIENIRVNYRRAGHTSGPTDSRAADTLFRMSRTDDGVPDEEYVPKTPAEAVALADAQTGKYSNGKPMSVGEAVKYLKNKAANGHVRGRR